MNINRISATLSQSDRDEIMAAIALIRAKLPFLMDLSADERRALNKMGDKSETFVRTALEIATQNQDYLPRAFDVEELRKDIELYEQLRPLVLALSQLQHLIEVTSMVVGSEAMGGALTVYNSAKVHGKGTGLEAIVKEMGQRRFSKSSNSSSDSGSTPTEPSEPSDR
jgi:hypothetical protein